MATTHEQQQLPILGGPIAWSLLDLSPRLPVLYTRCQENPDSEVYASEFAEALVRDLLEVVNMRLSPSGRSFHIDVVSQQPPATGLRRRIDVQPKSWGQTGSKLFPFVLTHVEVKRHGAQRKEVRELEAQIMTACEGTRQPLVYGIAFHGTAIRMWCFENSLLRSLTGSGSTDVADKSNWVDASQRGQPAYSILGAFYRMTDYPPYAMVDRAAVAVRPPPPSVWDLALAEFPRLENTKVPIPKHAQRSGYSTVLIQGRQYRLPESALAIFSRTRCQWKDLADHLAISNPAAAKKFRAADRAKKEGKDAVSLAYAGVQLAYRMRQFSAQSAAGPSGSTADQGEGEDDEDEDEDDDDEEDEDYEDEDEDDDHEETNESEGED